MDNSYEQMRNSSRDMEIPRKNQIEILEIKKKYNKNIISEMKYSFSELSSRLDIAKQRIGELKDAPIEIFQTEIQPEKEEEEPSKSYGTISHGLTYNWSPRRKRKNGEEKYLKRVAENFLKLTKDNKPEI